MTKITRRAKAYIAARGQSPEMGHVGRIDLEKLSGQVVSEKIYDVTL